MPADAFEGQGKGLTAFGKRFEAITPSDTDILYPYKCIIVGATGGPVAVHNHDDVAITLHGVAGMALQGVRPKRILATGTTATPLIGVIE